MRHSTLTSSVATCTLCTQHISAQAAAFPGLATLADAPRGQQHEQGLAPQSVGLDKYPNRRPRELWPHTASPGFPGNSRAHGKLHPAILAQQEVGGVGAGQAAENFQVKWDNPWGVTEHGRGRAPTSLLSRTVYLNAGTAEGGMKDISINKGVLQRSS